MGGITGGKDGSSSDDSGTPYGGAYSSLASALGGIASGEESIAGSQEQLAGGQENLAGLETGYGTNILGPAYSQYAAGATGSLTPAQQALVTESLGQMNLGTMANYANLGLGGSTMEQQDLNANQLNSLAQQAQLEQQSEQLGLQGLGTGLSFLGGAGSSLGGAESSLGGAAGTLGGATSSLADIGGIINALQGDYETTQQEDASGKSSLGSGLGSLLGGSATGNTGAGSSSLGSTLGSLFGDGSGAVDVGSF